MSQFLWITFHSLHFTLCVCVCEHTRVQDKSRDGAGVRGGRKLDNWSFLNSLGHSGDHCQSKALPPPLAPCCSWVTTHNYKYYKLGNETDPKMCVSDGGAIWAEGECAGWSAESTSSQHGWQPECPFSATLLYYTESSGLQGVYVGVGGWGVFVIVSVIIHKGMNKIHS